mmetsp:Transcript_41574/g.114529  ORF Transcript_41574/g.114529 Transcript_41574/m.114529 type:complete len:685 (+) Transcript_41574:102-2156(+)
MSLAQRLELEGIVAASLGSATIEWAMNLRVCDMLEANPSLGPAALAPIAEALRCSRPVPVQLALSLLEMVVKNCGLPLARQIDSDLAGALVALAKKRESAAYSLGRNLHKTVGGWLPGGISSEEREQWIGVSKKVLEMLQLWADAFFLEEGQAKPLFDAYKKLRRQGYAFPARDAQAGLMITGAEESPAFTAFGGGAAAAPQQAATTSAVPTSDAPRRAPSGATSESPSPIAPPEADVVDTGPRDAALTPAEVEELRRALSRLKAAEDSAEGEEPVSDEERQAMFARLRELQPRLVALIQRHTEEMGAEEADLDEVMLLGMISLHDELEAVLQGPDAGDDAAADADLLDLEDGAEEPATVPAPPSEPAPDRERQEQYDLILARYLQEQEDLAQSRQEEEDRAFAAMLQAMDGDGQALSAALAPAEITCGACGRQQRVEGLGAGRMFRCFQCGTLNRASVPPLPQGYAGHGQFGHHQAPQFAPQPRPQREAPPARSMAHLDPQGGSELLIGGSSASNAAAEADAKASGPRAGRVKSYAVGMNSNEKSESLLGGGSAEPALGDWARAQAANALHSFSSAATGSSGSKRLGDGVPSASRYVAIGEDEMAPLSGGPPAAKPKGSSGLRLANPFHRRRSNDSARESLLQRLRVDDDWEVIRRPDGTPYYHNVQTGTSQWEPPITMQRLT